MAATPYPAYKLSAEQAGEFPGSRKPGIALNPVTNRRDYARRRSLTGAGGSGALAGAAAGAAAGAEEAGWISRNEASILRSVSGLVSSASSAASIDGKRLSTSPNASPPAARYATYRRGRHGDGPQFCVREALAGADIRAQVNQHFSAIQSHRRSLTNNFQTTHQGKLRLFSHHETILAQTHPFTNGVGNQRRAAANDDRVRIAL